MSFSAESGALRDPRVTESMFGYPSVSRVFGKLKEETLEEGFTRRLREMVGERGLTQDGLATAVGAGVGTVNGWLKDGIIPRGGPMLRLPEALGCTADYLLLGRRPKYPVNRERAELAIGHIGAWIEWASASDGAAEAPEWLDRAARELAAYLEAGGGRETG